MVQTSPGRVPKKFRINPLCLTTLGSRKQQSWAPLAWIRSQVSQVLEIPRPGLGTPTNPFFVILDTAFSATVRDMLSTQIHLSLCVALVRSDDI